MRRKIALLFLLFLLSPPSVPTLLAAGWSDPGAEARCPVCGMFVGKYRNWWAAVVLKDGTTVYFDGPKDLFRYVFEIGRYRPAGGSDEVAEMFVTEYYSVRPLPVGEVYFVTGSDVLGPMGKELIPVAGLEAARTFQRDHGGAKLMRFDGAALVEVADPK
jgi:nitrous oxide reductase accessory protein NosL